ncbi:GDSL-like lipase/acylhydrolase family protein [Tamaricihabitans halophyticus]|uniref:GDSL-like lipase/acylhydrolase family protein n=1 Tax=Tamaricihabitans halophyticus TaxID=1262583 RepID=A0A4R2QS36_9PSEU|nr:SGNH/GDSL hydrolase family protein [Tamaricihabitans halophyticus]TCP51914.1 GDSL-like lipase/acylhydrolase family protein [Tamaricihabitans halophyticus]
MRMVRTLICAAAAALGVSVLAAPAVAAPAAENYVALGDSYASGVGAGDYGDSGDCKRSANAYPELWAAANEAASFDFQACLGARTDQVLEGQLDALTADTTTVTVTMGGNDAGFTDVMITCNTSSDQGCLDRLAEAEDFVNTELPAKLDSVYAAIAERAPNATVYAVGYPRFYELDGSCNAGLSEVKREAINGAADTLVEVTAQRAEAAGVTFVDVRTAFDGHGICSDDWWLHSVKLPADESYHPNVAGQNGYYEALAAVTG